MLIRRKITWLFSLLVFIILAITGFAIFYFSAWNRTDTFRQRLKNRAISTATAAAAISDSNYNILSKLDTSSVASLYNKSILLLNYHTYPAYQYADIPGNEIILTPDLIKLIKLNGEFYFDYNGRTAMAIHFTDARNNFILAVAAEDTDGATFLFGLKKLLLWCFFTALLITYITGVFFAKVLLNPIAEMIAEVNLISTNNLSQRIKEGNSKDEINKLAATFNDLLNRMQESFIIQRRFISNASHELSTPLTAISSQLEVTLQKERSASEYRNTLTSIQEDIRDIQLLTRSLLDIAKTGVQGSIDLEDIRIDELLLKVASDVQKIHADYKVSINFRNFPEKEHLLTIFGNNHLLYIAFKNILENGCKYSDDHTANTEIIFSDTDVTIDIISKGDIIAEKDIQTIFEPFFRAETVRQKEGFGLGLTLTRRILSLHHATIEVVSNQAEGTKFSIVLPHKP